MKAIESYSAPFSHIQKAIVKENTRLPEFMRPTTKPRSGEAKDGDLGKRDMMTLSTPDLLGIRRESSPMSKTPFNLKELLGESTNQDDSDEEKSVVNREEGFRPLRFPSPSPSKLLLTMLGMIDSPLMTWGEIQSEPMKLGPISIREAVD
jgi:hypothetical protein